MAGVLAPTIGEVGGTQGGVGAPVDTSIGEALSSVSSIFGAALETTQDGSTQTERDRAALQPFVEQLQDLDKKRKAGMSPAEFNVRSRAVFNSALAALPDKTNEIKSVFSTITGEEFAEPAKDLETELENTIIAWATDPKNPIGQAAFLESFTTDAQGNYDDASTKLKLQQKFFENQTRAAKIQELSLMKEQLDLGGQIDEARQDRSVEEFMAGLSTNVQEAMEGVMRTFPMLFPEGVGVSPSGTVLDRESAITELTALRSRYLTFARAMAAQGGILDNIERKFEGGINSIVAPIDNTIAFLTRMGDERFNVLKSMDTEGKIQFLNILKEAGVPGGERLAESEFITNQVLRIFSADISQALVRMRENRDAFAQGPVRKTLGDNAVDQDGNPSPELSGMANTMSLSEMRDQVKTSVAKFKSLDMTPQDDELTRRIGVEEFVIATDLMNNRGVPVAEETFDKIYDPRFFNVYNLLQVRRGPEADALDRAIENNLRTLLVQRKLTAEVSIKGALGQEFPTMQLVFDGNKFTVKNTRRGKKPQTILEHRVFPLLKKHGLDFTFEGLKELQKLERDQAPALGLNRFLGEIENQLRYLNKIVGVAQKFPEELRNRILPSNEVQSIPRISSDDVNGPKEYAKLKAGQEYEIEYTDGSIRRFTKGDE